MWLVYVAQFPPIWHVLLYTGSSHPELHHSEEVGLSNRGRWRSQLD